MAESIPKGKGARSMLRDPDQRERRARGCIMLARFLEQPPRDAEMTARARHGGG